MASRIHPEIARLFRARLQEGETILWQSRRDPSAAARSGAASGGAAVFMLLLGLFWLRVLLKVAFNHPSALLNPSLLSPFALIAAVLGWGAWRACQAALRTGYAVTDRRLLLVLEGKEPIFHGREREAWGYVKLSVRPSGIGDVTHAPSASAAGTSYSEVGDAAGLFNLLASSAGGTSRTLLPPNFGPAQLSLVPDERVLWQAEADAGLLARALTRDTLIVVALAEGSVALLTSVYLGVISAPPAVYLLCLFAFLALAISSWFSVRRWAARKAARTAADRFYAFTDRRLVIARRTSRTEIIQYALDRLEVRESIPGQHKIRLRTARADDPGMVYLTDDDGVYSRLMGAVSRAKRDRAEAGHSPTDPAGGREPDLSGDDPLDRQLRRGEEILWRGNSQRGGRQAAIYALEAFARAALVIVAFPLVMGAGAVGWGVAGGCGTLAALFALSVATTARGTIRNQEYAITDRRLLIARRTSDGKRRLVQADLREPVNVTLSVNPKTGLGTFEIACHESATAFAAAESRVRCLSLSLLSVGNPIRVYNLLAAAHLARPVPQSVLTGEDDSLNPFAPFLRPNEIIRWQGKPEPAEADARMRWDSDRFLSPVWALIWSGLLTGAGHVAGYAWPNAALRALPFAAFALAARYEPKRARPVNQTHYALTSQRLISLDRDEGFTLSDLDLERVERILTLEKPRDKATFVFLVGENRVRWADVGNADAVYGQVDKAVAEARAQQGGAATEVMTVDKCTG